MQPWPALAGKAFCLKDNSRPAETVFFYDSAPPDTNAAKPLPVFILIHGLGDEADSWRHLIPLLNCRVLALDLPGFGRSVAAGRISLKSYAAVVLKLITAVITPHSGEGGEPCRPAVFLVGSSMGALVAEEAALQMPELVSGMILIGGSIPGGPQNPGLFALAKILFSKKWYKAYRKKPKDLWTSLYPYYADLDSMPPEDKDFLQRRIMARVESPAQEQAFFAVQRNLVRTYLTAASRFARRIQRYKGKILLIWGEQDRIIPLSSAKAFTTLREGIRLEIISGAGHLPHQEKPAEIARLIGEFAKAQVN